MDFDTGILSLIEGYVDGALSSTGTKRAVRAPALEPQFEGDTIPDLPRASRPPTYDDFDELVTGVIDQQRLIR